MDYDFKNLKSYILYHIAEYGLKRSVVEHSTGIRIENLQKFPSHYTGPSLRDLFDLLSLDEAHTYSRFKYLPKECVELLFDERILRFFVWLYRSDTSTREEIFKILDRLSQADRVKPDPPE